MHRLPVLKLLSVPVLGDEDLSVFMAWNMSYRVTHYWRSA
jgi:hypothetical protein